MYKNLLEKWNYYIINSIKSKNNLWKKLYQKIKIKKINIYNKKLNKVYKDQIPSKLQIGEKVSEIQK